MTQTIVPTADADAGNWVGAVTPEGGASSVWQGIGGPDPLHIQGITADVGGGMGNVVTLFDAPAIRPPDGTTEGTLRYAIRRTGGTPDLGEDSLVAVLIGTIGAPTVVAIFDGPEITGAWQSFESVVSLLVGLDDIDWADLKLYFTVGVVDSGSGDGFIYEARDLSFEVAGTTPTPAAFQILTPVRGEYVPRAN